MGDGRSHVEDVLERYAEKPDAHRRYEKYSAGRSAMRHRSTGCWSCAGASAARGH